MFTCSLYCQGSEVWQKKGANNSFVITNMTTKEEKKDEKNPTTDKKEVSM
jgi:hypothetical protein